MLQNMIVVESGVPVPFSISSNGQRVTYPFSRMAVGDSFEVPTHAGAVKSVRASASRYAKSNRGKKFAIWKIAPRSKTYRCWRIA
jgi:hypothetical protein